jgi:Sec-independent protein translocase protein TatA
MELFGIGWMEVIFILVLILLIAGPKDIEKGARSFGRFLNKLYRSPSYNAVRRASTELRNLPNRLAREAQLEELHSLKDLDKELRQDLQNTASAVNASLTGRPPAAPKPPVTPPPIAPPPVSTSPVTPPMASPPPATTPSASTAPAPAPRAAARADEAFSAWVTDLGAPPAPPAADSPEPEKPAA